MENFGLYVHIPFCISKCIYCDFLSKPCSAEIIDEYFNALYAEIAEQGKNLNKTVTTVYIGGGTPSLVDTIYIDKLFFVIKQTFKCDFKEVTIEANPESLMDDKLNCYKKNGINRISIGVQTLNNNLLKIIGRPHNSKQALDAICLAKKYFKNVSADIILGLPNQTIKDIEVTLQKLINLDLTHISAYGLKVEKNTKLYDLVKNKVLTVDEDLAVDMYDKTVSILGNAGFKRYEISNFAKSGFKSLHNFNYWKRCDYLGVGAGAFSFIDNLRWNNVISIENYIKLIKENSSVKENFEKINGENAKFEEIMLALRTSDGLDIENFNKNFNADFKTDYQSVLKKIHNKITINNSRIAVKPKYLYTLNSILLEFMN